MSSTTRYLKTALAALTTLAASTVGAGAAAAATAAPHATSPVVLKVAAATIEAGSKARFGAAVNPRTPGIVLTLQRHRNGKWQNIATAVTNHSGLVTFHHTFTAPATYKLRVSVTPTALVPAEVSTVQLEQVTPIPPPYAGPSVLQENATGERVTALQQRLVQLGYWLGTPDGFYGDSTQQAVYAFQKVAGLNPDGDVGADTVAALVAGDEPTPRTHSGYVIEVNLKNQYLMVVRNGQVLDTLNISSGGGYTYVESGVSSVAATPTGIFSIYRVVDGLVTDPLGQLWRPRFFTGGYAIHGDSYVPGYAASHGCVRISNEAINWVWANNIMPLDTEVDVYGPSVPADSPAGLAAAAAAKAAASQSAATTTTTTPGTTTSSSTTTTTPVATSTT